MASEDIPEEKKKESTTWSVLKLLLKIGVTVLCFWYISRKIDFSSALSAFRSADWSYLFIALLFFILSKLLSAFRLNIYFRNIGLSLPSLVNVRLYWLGMFYNLFLPGAISGDAYKVILLKRRYNTNYRNTSAAVLLDRFSGLLALGIILSIYGIIVLDQVMHELFIAGGAILAVVIFYLVVKKYLKDFLPGFVPTLFWGLAVQFSQVICVYFILSALHLPSDHEWIFIFLAAAVISVLPISLGGGLGTRELVFTEGAIFFHLDPHAGIVISLLFYIITVMGSLWGVYYVFHDPLGKVRLN